MWFHSEIGTVRVIHKSIPSDRFASFFPIPYFACFSFCVTLDCFPFETRSIVEIFTHPPSLQVVHLRSFWCLSRFQSEGHYHYSACSFPHSPTHSLVFCSSSSPKHLRVVHSRDIPPNFSHPTHGRGVRGDNSHSILGHCFLSLYLIWWVRPGAVSEWIYGHHGHFFVGAVVAASFRSAGVAISLRPFHSFVPFSAGFVSYSVLKSADSFAAFLFLSLSPLLVCFILRIPFSTPSLSSLLFQRNEPTITVAHLPFCVELSVNTGEIEQRRGTHFRFTKSLILLLFSTRLL